MRLVADVRAGVPIVDAAQRNDVDVSVACEHLFEDFMASQSPLEDATLLAEVVDRAASRLGTTPDLLALRGLAMSLRLTSGAGRPVAVRLLTLVSELDRDGVTGSGAVLRVRTVGLLYANGSLDKQLAKGFAFVDGVGLNQLPTIPVEGAVVDMTMATAYTVLGDAQRASEHAIASLEALLASDQPSWNGLVPAVLNLQLHIAAISEDPVKRTRAVIDSIEAVPGRDDVVLCDAEEQLLELLLAGGHEADVNALLPRALARLELALGPDHPRTWFLRVVDEVRRRQYTGRAATDRWRELADGAAKALGADDETTFNARFELMQALTQQDAEQGVTYGASLLADARRALGDADPTTRNIRRFLEHRVTHHSNNATHARSTAAGRNKLTGSRKTRDRVLAEFRDGIAKNGWIVHAIGADCDRPGHSHTGHEHGPDFGYTNGLTRYRDHPELIVTGVPQNAVGSLLNILGERVKEGERLEAGQRLSGVAEGYEVLLIDVDPANSAGYLTMANAVYRLPGRPPIRALQVVMPDIDHRWPWEDGVTDTFRAAQPLLGTVP